MFSLSQKNRTLYSKSYTPWVRSVLALSYSAPCWSATETSSTPRPHNSRILAAPAFQKDSPPPSFSCST